MDEGPPAGEIAIRLQGEPILNSPPHGWAGEARATPGLADSKGSAV